MPPTFLAQLREHRRLHALLIEDFEAGMKSIEALPGSHLKAVMLRAQRDSLAQLTESLAKFDAMMELEERSGLKADEQTSLAFDVLPSPP